MKIKVGDKVEVITGANKGKSGKVITVLRNKDRVVIEKVNIVKKHVKPNGQKETGGILEVEAPIHVSNVRKIEDKKEEKKDTKKVTKSAEVKAEKKVTKKSKE